MKIIKSNKFKNAILSYVKNLVDKSLYESFKTLLEPCCRPDLVVNSISCTGTDVTRFNVSLTGLSKNTTYVLVARLTDSDKNTTITSTTVSTTTSTSWVGNISFPVSITDGVGAIKVGIVTEGSDVVINSNIVNVTTIPDCS